MSGARAPALRAPRGFTPTRAHVLLTAVCLTALLGARPAAAGWQTFGLADGLAGLPGTSIAQDADESLWFATRAGVSRYDGAFFRNFRTDDGLASNIVHTVHVDRAGRVWFGTNSGASRYDRGTWTTLDVSAGLVSNDVRAILEDRLGRFWFATGDFGASRYDGTSWTTFQQSDGLAANQLTCLYEDAAGDIWFGTQGAGISRFDGTSWTHYRGDNTAYGLRADYIECILQTRDGAMWVGTRAGGLSRFDGTTWTNYMTAGTLGLTNVTALREDAGGTLWVGSNAGVARWDGQTWRSYTTADGLAEGFVSAIFFDRSGNCWVGTQSGVSRYDGESWTRYFDAGLGGFGAQAVFEDRAGVIWAGTAGAGVARYDRTAWASVTAGSTGGGLASDMVTSVVQDSSGAMWFGTPAGASRLDGSLWQTFTSASGVAGSNVSALARDSSGGVWVGTTAGLSRFDGAIWRSYTTGNGLPANRIRALHADRAGRIWAGTSAGVAVLDGTVWTRYSTADGLADPNVYAILQDHSGAMWFGTAGGLSRFDGVTWQTYRIDDGLAGNWVLSLAETRDSVLWIGTFDAGLSRFDGALWQTYTTLEGLPDQMVSAALVERSGNLWFGTAQGAALYEHALVPPQTVITGAPPVLSANTLQTISFVAAYRQVLGIEFSTSLNTRPWSPWSADNAWVERDLPDGVHTFRVRARDRLHHVDLTPASCTFEVAATPPAPIITAPVFREPVRDTLLVTGTAEALRFRSFRVDVRPAGATSWDPPDATMLVQSTTAVRAGLLTRLATADLPDGDYELRLAVQNTLGLTGIAQVTFIVDNVAPFAAQTTPALVSALTGGDVYTTNGESHVYIPPRGLPRDATLHIDPLEASAVPATLPDGAIRLAPGFAIGTEGVPLEKDAVLDLAVPGGATPAGTRLALYTAGPDGVWRRLGGTVDGAGARIATPFREAASYAIFGAPLESPVPAPALTLSLTPRIFSSRGALANASVRIGFVLARAGSVTVTIHNRAGRLVRVVTSGETLGPGTNLVSWDGRDEDRHDVESGLYVVTVEALGEKRMQTLAVVR